MQEEEIMKRQMAIDRLERELMREKRFKHSDHICDNCNEPCVKKMPDCEKHTCKKDAQIHSRQFKFKKLNEKSNYNNRINKPNNINETNNRYSPITNGQ